MADLSHIPLVVIGGPTAVGKTQLSIDLAKRFGGEIINGDRLQCYRGLDIGTGKVTIDEMAGIPHHLLDFLDWDQAYDASQFKRDATACIQSIWQRGKLPILVGGSGLYLEGLLYHLEFGGQDSQNDVVRQQLQLQLAQEGAEVLWQRLYAQDPAAAAKIPVQNTRRLVRALEVIQLTGNKFSSQVRHELAQPVFNDLVLVLDRPREQLYQRINQRVALMEAQGLESEARRLFQASAGRDLPSIQGIGYKEWWPYFAIQDQPLPSDTLTKEAVIAQIQQNSRRYAKRQLTWFRHRIRAHWLDASQYDKAKIAAEHLIKQQFE